MRGLFLFLLSSSLYADQTRNIIERAFDEPAKDDIEFVHSGGYQYKYVDGKEQMTVDVNYSLEYNINERTQMTISTGNSITDERISDLDQLKFEIKIGF